MVLIMLYTLMKMENQSYLLNYNNKYDFKIIYNENELFKNNVVNFILNVNKTSNLTIHLVFQKLKNMIKNILYGEISTLFIKITYINTQQIVKTKEVY